MWIVTAGQGALLALSGCQQGQGAWISGPVSATETSLLVQNRFPHPPRAAARPQIPPPYLQAVENGREVAESVGPGRVDGTVL
jgi:hypothetical protein